MSSSPAVQIAPEDRTPFNSYQLMMKNVISSWPTAHAYPQPGV